MKDEQTMVTEKEIENVWGNSNFGSMSKMDVVKYGLLKCAGGYYQGRTSTSILEELKLIKKLKKCHKLTLRGQRNLYNFFKDEKKSI